MTMFRAAPLASFEPWSSAGEFPTRALGWSGAALELHDAGTHYLYVQEGVAALEFGAGSFTLRAGMYAMVPGRAAISGQGAGLVVTRLGYSGPFLLGGPIESEGRLRYIDGCTDSLLLAPSVRGEPCLNHLHIPAGTAQSAHVHPSVRVGVIARGRGECVTAQARYVLSPGLGFVIEPHVRHSFHTGAETLDVVVYHPDSDTGPTHRDHPMINRTLL
jgi:quercetin dioxygenase-like cupin family protein